MLLILKLKKFKELTRIILIFINIKKFTIMKTFGKMSFGFGVVNAGQRNASYEPEFIATSTPGTFRITPPVSKALFVGHGDNVMFVTNVNNIDEAIRDNAPEIVAFCEEHGLEVGSTEAAIAIHREFDAWGIAKGVVEKDAKGNKRTCRVRMTKADKQKYVEANFEECLEAARNSSNEELVAAITREGITEKEVKEILASAIQGDETDKYTGSKCSNAATITGIGTSLTFTDSNVWNQMKSYLGDNADKVNLIYSVDVDNLIDAEIFNGYETITVKVAVLGETREEAPVARNKK